MTTLSHAPQAVAARVQSVAQWWRGTAVLGVLLALNVIAFTALAIGAHFVPYFEIDLQWTRALQQLRTPELEMLGTAASWPGFPPQSNYIFGTLIALLAIGRKFIAAVAEAVAAAGSAILWFQLNPLVGRPRPDPELVYVSNYIEAGSFPSGHVLNLTASLGFAWFLAYTLLPKSWYRTAVLWILPAYLLVMGTSRVFIGQHWPSDVLGGYLLGLLWLWVTIAGYRWAAKWTDRRQRESLNAPAAIPAESKA